MGGKPFFIIDDLDEEQYQEQIEKELDEERSTYCSWVKNKRILPQIHEKHAEQIENQEIQHDL